VRGIEITPETLSAAAIAEVVNGPGHFLGHGQTLAMMQSEYIYPLVGDRLSPDDWRDAGARTAVEAAHDVVTAVLADGPPKHLPPDVDRRLREHFDIRLPPPVR
jgi:trimethylamine--corrinoid protein Co-methyltransferase